MVTSGGGLPPQEEQKNDHQESAEERDQQANAQAARLFGYETHEQGNGRAAERCQGKDNAAQRASGGTLARRVKANQSTSTAKATPTAT